MLIFALRDTDAHLYSAYQKMCVVSDVLSPKLAILNNNLLIIDVSISVGQITRSHPIADPS
ncbi:MAG: hypothetical protein ACI9OF_001643 [Saprospiraceae bacterium]|jgi:hypothetical protein